MTKTQALFTSTDILDMTLSKMKEGIHQEENSFLFSPKFTRVARGGELATSRHYSETLLERCTLC